MTAQPQGMLSNKDDSPTGKVFDFGRMVINKTRKWKGTILTLTCTNLSEPADYNKA